MDSEKCFALYFPEDMHEEKEKTYFALLDIGANFSKLIQAILPQIKKHAEEIIKQKKRFRDFTWTLTITPKG